MADVIGGSGSDPPDPYKGRGDGRHIPSDRVSVSGRFREKQKKGQRKATGLNLQAVPRHESREGKECGLKRAPSAWSPADQALYDEMRRDGRVSPPNSGIRETDEPIKALGYTLPMTWIA